MAAHDLSTTPSLSTCETLATRTIHRERTGPAASGGLAASCPTTFAPHGRGRPRARGGLPVREPRIVNLPGGLQERRRSGHVGALGACLDETVAAFGLVRGGRLRPDPGAPTHRLSTGCSSHPDAWPSRKRPLAGRFLAVASENPGRVRMFSRAGGPGSGGMPGIRAKFRVRMGSTPSRHARGAPSTSTCPAFAFVRQQRRGA